MAFTNFAYGTIVTPPSPATSGVTMTLTTGHAARMPSTPFNASVWAAGAMPDPLNAEIVQVTGIAGDVVTFVRAQEGTTARAIVAGDQIAATITALTLTTLSSWSNLTGTPTTLAGYGIVDAAALSHTHAFSALTSKPTTLSGYGITDAQPVLAINTLPVRRFLMQISSGTPSWVALVAGDISFTVATATFANSAGRLNSGNTINGVSFDGTVPITITVSASDIVAGTLAAARVATLNQNTTGSAATLTTPRAINGVNFDGSAAITVTADANTLSGTTLKSTVLASSLTSVGTLTGGATGAGFTIALTTSTVTGALADARLSANVPLLNAAGLTFTPASGNFVINSSAANGSYILLQRSGANKTFLGSSAIISTVGTNNDTDLYSNGALRLISAIGSVYVTGYTTFSSAIAAGDLSVGHIQQSSGHYFYPGAVSGLSSYQSSYYIASHSSWGLYINTGLYVDGGVTTTTSVTSSTFTDSYMGYKSRAGTWGGWSGNYTNIYWTGAAQMWIDGTNVGNLTITSDRRSKKNITPMTIGLAELLLLRPQSFEWINKETGEGTQYGLIAQDVVTIIPAIATQMTLKTEEAPDGLWRVDYLSLVPVLIRAVQELSAELTTLKGAK